MSKYYEILWEFENQIEIIADKDSYTWLNSGCL